MNGLLAPRNARNPSELVPSVASLPLTTLDASRR